MLNVFKTVRFWHPCSPLQYFVLILCQEKKHILKFRHTFNFHWFQWNKKNRFKIMLKGFQTRSELGNKSFFWLAWVWTELSVIWVIFFPAVPLQQEKGNPSEELLNVMYMCFLHYLLRYQFLLLGVSPRTIFIKIYLLSLEPILTHIQISHNFKVIFWKAKQKVQEVLKIT